MKGLKILVLMTVLLCSQAAFSQTQRGDIQVGGSLGGSYQINANYKGSFIKTALSNGFFFTDGFVLRYNLGYGYTHIKYDNSDNFKKNEFTASIGLRHYFKTGVLQPLVGFGIGYRLEERDLGTIGGGNPSLSSDSSSSLDIELGASYFLSDNIALELIMHPKMDNISFLIGAQIYL